MFWIGLINCGYGWYLSMQFGVYSVMFLYCEHDVLFISTILSRFTLSKLWLKPSPNVKVKRFGKDTWWQLSELACAIWTQVRQDTQLLFMGASHLPSRNKTTKPSFGKNMSLQLRQTDPAWSRLRLKYRPKRKCSLSSRSLSWSSPGSNENPVGRDGKKYPMHVMHSFVHWCYSFFRTCL